MLSSGGAGPAPVGKVLEGVPLLGGTAASEWPLKLQPCDSVASIPTGIVIGVTLGPQGNASVSSFRRPILLLEGHWLSGSRSALRVRSRAVPALRWSFPRGFLALLIGTVTPSQLAPGGSAGRSLP